MVDFAAAALRHRIARETASASLVDFEAVPEQVCLTFGKHKGLPLSEVETSYLEWVKTADRITPSLLAAIDVELASRAPSVKVKDRWRAPTGVPEETLLCARLIVDAGQEALNLAVGSHHVDGAAQLLRAYLDSILLETGDLPF